MKISDKGLILQSETSGSLTGGNLRLNNKKLTVFGELLRDIRYDHNTRLQTLSNAIGVSTSYLSAVELGNKNISIDTIKKIVNYFDLNIDTYMLMVRLANFSVASVKVDLTRLHGESRFEAVFICRNLTKLGKDQLNKIFQIVRDG